MSQLYLLLHISLLFTAISSNHLNQWKDATNHMSPRTNYGEAKLRHVNQALIFGGHTDEGIQNDLWLISHKHNETTATDSYSVLLTPLETNITPPIRIDSSFTGVTSNHALLFGGINTTRKQNPISMNDVWLLEYTNTLEKTAHWSKLKADVTVVARHQHKSVLLPTKSNSEHATLLIFGGRNGHLLYPNTELMLLNYKLKTVKQKVLFHELRGNEILGLKSLAPKVFLRQLILKQLMN